MKKVILAISMLAMVAGCSSADEEHVGMLQLQLLLTQAATLAAMPQPEARAKAAVLARRAMSGPEMQSMHHEGAKSPMMQATHDLGDAVFAVLEAGSKSLSEDWRQRLLLAAQSASMRLAGSMQGDALGRFSYSEARQLSAGQLLKQADKAQAKGAYAAAASHLIDRLNALATNF